MGVGTDGGRVLRDGVLGGAKPETLCAWPCSGRHQRGRNLLPEPWQECGTRQAPIFRARGDASGCAGPEALRFVGLPDGIAANVRQMLYGAALVIVIWMQSYRRAESKLSTEHLT